MIRFGKILLGVTLLGLSLVEAVTFERVFGGEEDDIAKAVVETADGYLIAGQSNSFTEYRNFDGYLVKIDKNGNKIWSKTYGGKYDEEIDELVKYGDGYLFLGTTKTYGNKKSSFYLGSVDQNGSTRWLNAFYTNDDDEFFGKALAVMGETIVFGGTRRHLQFFSAKIEPTLLQINKELEYEWKGHYGGEDEDNANAVVATDGGYLMVGDTESYGDEGFNGYAVMVDKNGTKRWYNAFGGDEDDTANDVVATDDGYMIVGSTESFDISYKDIYLVKLNKSGKIIWEKLYGRELDDEGYALTTTKDGGFVIVGNSGSDDGRKELYLFKIDKDGKRLWSRTYGGESDDAGYDVIATEDGGYLVVGDKKSNRSRDSNMWVLKLDENGKIK